MSQLGQGGSFTNLAQQLRRAAVMLLGADSHLTGLLILEYLAQHRVPDANPAVASQLDELGPLARDAITEAEHAELVERAATIDHAVLVDEIVAALRAAAEASTADG